MIFNICRETIMPGIVVIMFDYFSSWSHSYSPGPATINGISENMVGCALGQAHVGDRESATLDTVGFVNRIVYMQIVGRSFGKHCC